MTFKTNVTLFPETALEQHAGKFTDLNVDSGPGTSMSVYWCTALVQPAILRQLLDKD